MKTDLLEPMEDEYQPTPEEEADHWCAPGWITFYVQQNVPDVFEIEVLDQAGCAGGMAETVGIDYWIKEDADLVAQLREGVTYTLENLTVVWTRGDGWTTDDDVEWYFDTLSHETTLWTYLSQKVKNIWWRQVVCRWKGRV